jgi:outer membrane protein assembly factor BamB
VATGLIHDGHVYGVQTAGIADCVDLYTGEIVWQQRLQGSGANNAVWSSPIRSGDRIYVMNQNGDVFIYAAETEFEVLATNSLGERTNSSVVPSNGRLYLRTHEALWCVETN